MVVPATTRPEEALADARARCFALARRHGENFTVVSLLAPRALRMHLAVVYAYCRAVDDLGDEGRLPSELASSGSPKRSAPSDVAPRAGRPDGLSAAEDRSVPPGTQRLELLAAFERELDLAYTGRSETPLFVALAATVREFDLPREPFARLIEANRIDQKTTRYRTV